MATRPRVLVRLAYSAEDVATRLRNFRNGLTGQDARITSSISKLFAISSLLQQLDEAQNDRDQGPSFYRIRDDVSIVIPSLERTLQDSLEMVARSQNRPSEVAWDDMQFQMSREEGLGLHERLALYHDFLRAQSSILAGIQAPLSIVDMRRQLRVLQNAQELGQTRLGYQPITDSRKSQLRSQHLQSPIC